MNAENTSLLVSVLFLFYLSCLILLPQPRHVWLPLFKFPLSGAFNLVLSAALVVFAFGFADSVCLVCFFSLNLVKKALWLTDKRISSLDFPFLHDWRPMFLQSSHICSSVARRTEATFNKLPAERTIKAGGCMWSQLSIGFFNVIVHQIRGRNMKSISAVWSLLSLENPCSRVAYCTNKQRQSAN